MEDLGEAITGIELQDDWDEASMMKIADYFESVVMKSKGHEDTRATQISVPNFVPPMPDALITVVTMRNSYGDSVRMPQTLEAYYDPGAPESTINECRISRGRYVQPSPQQWDFFMYLMVDKGFSVNKAAKMCSIPKTTAYNWYNRFQTQGVVASKKRGPKTKLTDEHMEYLNDVFKENCTTTLSTCVELLRARFGVEVCTTTIHRHIVERLNMTCKTVSKEVTRRNSSDTKWKRRAFVLEQLSTANADYLKNCVFIDEAAFDTNMRANQGWAPKGKKAIVKVPAARALSYSLLGAICASGVVLLAARDPKVEVSVNLLHRSQAYSSKKRKLDDGVACEVPKTIKTRGTTAVHFFEFITKVLDVLDSDPNRTFKVLVMDNVSFHKGKIIGDYIKKRGYNALFIPPYSPDLNPIENYWAVLKFHVRRSEMKRNNSIEDLIQAITSASQKIPNSTIHSMINHSVKFFDSCLDREDI
ncbi:Tc1/mariner-like transposase, DDE-like motif [Diutina catenulata]